MADLSDAITALSETLDAASHIVSAADLAPVTEMARAAEKRHGFLGDTVVIALAGGTGSGKSSLLNALAGQDVSIVGAVRPTTAEPLAWIPANPEPGLVRLLDDLGLERRVGHDHRLPVAIIDLPDYDSVEFAHRATVEALIPRVDAVIWVLDPQKYSDRSLHRDYLVPLAGYADQFLFVLNQVDRLDQTGLTAVLEDLTKRLSSEGFEAPRIVTTAARPVDGDVQGVDALVEVIAKRFEAKRTAHAKLLEDLRRAHRLLTGMSGVTTDADPGLASRWGEAKRAAVDDLADLVAGPAMAQQAEKVGERMAASRAAGPIGRLGALLRRSRLGRAFGAAPDEVAVGEWWSQPGLERVLGGLNRAIIDVSTSLGGGLGRRVRGSLNPAGLEADVRGSVEGARHAVGQLGPPAPRRWWVAVGALQLVLFAGLIGGLVWVWVDGVDRGEVPWNLILVGGSVVLAVLLGLATGSSGRRAGRLGARDYRSRLVEALEGQLEARIGGGLAEAVATRDRLVQSLSRLATATESAAQDLARRD